MARRIVSVPAVCAVLPMFVLWMGSPYFTGAVCMTVPEPPAKKVIVLATTGQARRNQSAVT